MGQAEPQVQEVLEQMRIQHGHRQLLQGFLGLTHAAAVVAALEEVQ
jgi:hypothetical protein